MIFSFWFSSYESNNRNWTKLFEHCPLIMSTNYALLFYTLTLGKKASSFLGKILFYDVLLYLNLPPWGSQIIISTCLIPILHQCKGLGPVGHSRIKTCGLLACCREHQHLQWLLAERPRLWTLYHRQEPQHGLRGFS